MMQLVMLFILTLLQAMAGFGALTFLQFICKPVLFIAFSLIIGVGIFSLVPFFLQLLHVPLSLPNIFMSIGFVVIVLNFRVRTKIRMARQIFRSWKFNFKLYEIPFLFVIFLLVMVSVWRCFYFPPFPRDVTSGAEAIAEYATREKTMINSVFSINMESTNNTFKPPFITSLQVIYKYAGFAFGQLWLSTLFISFLIFLYQVLIRNLHPLIAGLVLIFFIAIPEMYAYTFMALYDYSNAVYFTLASYFLLQFLESNEHKNILMSGLVMGLATYTRSETLVLTILLLPFIVWYYIKNWYGLKKTALQCFIFLLPSIILYGLSVVIYIDYYLPVSYPVHDLINANWINPQPFFTRFIDMTTQVILSETGIIYYGYFIFFILFVLIFDLVLTTSWNIQSKFWIFVVIIIYIGIPLLGYLLPLYDLDNSTKRGLFKIFPPMLLYLGYSGILKNLSEIIWNWEKK